MTVVLVGLLACVLNGLALFAMWTMGRSLGHTEGRTGALRELCEYLESRDDRRTP